MALRENIIEKKLDCMVQQWACKQRSYLSFYQAEVGHHYYSRRHKLLRWDLLNIIPLTNEEHRNVHDGKYIIEIQNPFRELYLSQRANMDYKQYLLENGWSEREFLQRCYEKIERELDDNNKSGIFK